ncbi:MAG: putative toxin-antitoxin system toxin component, PIN family [Rhodocyclaceae bacterium]|nr:MAG: putative toxin-antitoxin system toxin component, PIN family [Rhodocyclaceae bacterium]
MQRMFIVDTNVVVAGLITTQADSPTAQVLDAMLDGRLIYLLSADLLREYRAIVLRPKLARAHGLNETEIDTLLTEITANALWRDPPSDDLHQAPDPRDRHLWALLSCEPSAVLVTGDRLLQQNPRPGSSVISPARWAGEFLD